MRLDSQEAEGLQKVVRLVSEAESILEKLRPVEGFASCAPPTKQTCTIVNDQFSYVLQVGGRNIPFQGRDAAEYFVQFYNSLGYKVHFDNSKWEKKA